MGVELELAVLLTIQLVGTEVFARFEIETPAWRKIVKWAVIAGATLVSYDYIGHWALLIPAGLAVAGLLFHLIWCIRHGIHPIFATPRKKYYELRGWKYRE